MQGRGDADRIAFLEGVVADEVGRHLPGDADDRDGIHQRVGQAGHGVGRARARGHQHHADLAGRAGIALGGVHGRLLVAHQHMAQPVLLEERIVDRKDGATGIAEDDLDFLVDQGFHQQIGAGRGGLLGLRHSALLLTNVPQNGGLRRGGP